MIISPPIKAILPLIAAATTTLAAVNYPPIPADKTTPFQQRLAINGPNSMSIGWNTFEKLPQPCVSYGLSSTQLLQDACSTTNNSITYPTSRTYSNAVILPNLRPDTIYYYKINSTNSTIQHFLSPRSIGSPTPFNMTIVIDLGVYGENGYTTTKRSTIPQISPELNHSTIGALARTIDSYDFILHPGDFAYADDWFETPSNLLDGKNAYEAILENFYGQLAPITSRKPYMVSPGNHEAACQEVSAGLCPVGQRNFTDFMNRFGRTMPQQNNNNNNALSSSSHSRAARAQARAAASLAVPPFWYSFDYGMVHVVMISTETDFPGAPDGPGTRLNGGNFGAPGQQLAFLEADLAGVDRRVTPWVVLGGHRPWYSTGGGGCTACQEAFEDVMYRYGVDVAIFGHVHNSQRFDPMFRNVTDPAGLRNPKAPMYLVVGGTGNIEGLSEVGKNSTGNVFAYADDFSYANVKFLDRDHLGVDFFRSSTGELLDSSVLYKDHSVNFVVQGD